MPQNNWTPDIRREIAAQGFSTDCCRRAFLSALVHTAGSIVLSRGGVAVSLPARDDKTAARAKKLFLELYGLAARMEGRMLVFDGAAAALIDLGILTVSGSGAGIVPGLSRECLRGECCRVNALRGAFSGCGSVSASDGYRLTFSVQSGAFADDLIDLLRAFGIEAAGLTPKRGGRHTVSVSGLDGVSDLIALLGAGETVATLQSESVLRTVRQNANRALNCELGNIQKLVDTSMRQVAAIRTIEREEGLNVLPAKLREAAALRLQYPEDSLEQLAARAGLSKSALRYRLTLLTDRATQITKEK